MACAWARFPPHRSGNVNISRPWREWNVGQQKTGRGTAMNQQEEPRTLSQDGMAAQRDPAEGAPASEDEVAGTPQRKGPSSAPDPVEGEAD